MVAMLVGHEDGVKIGGGKPLTGEAPLDFLHREAAVHEQARRADLDHECVAATPAAK